MVRARTRGLPVARVQAFAEQTEMVEVTARVRALVDEDPLGAANLLDEHIRKFGTSGDMVTARAYVLRALGQESQAQYLLQERLGQTLDPAALLLLALLLLEQGKGQQASDLVRRHSVLDDPDVYAARFHVVAGMQDRSSAAEVALGNCPLEDRKGRIAMTGKIALRQGRSRAARVFAVWSDELEGFSPDHEELLARLAIRKRRYKEAKARIDAHRAIGGPLAVSDHLEGLLLTRQGRHAEAAVRYEAALAPKPWWPASRLMVAWAAFWLREWDQLESHALQIDSQSPIDAITLRFMAALCRGRMREAFRLLKSEQTINRKADD